MHADMSQRVVIETGAAPWLAAAADGGEGGCKPLDRLDAGRRTTSLVRAAAGAVFARPDAALGEEMLVLDGSLADAHGNYAAGTYLRHPSGAVAELRSAAGCVLFVKRYPFAAGDTVAVRLDTATASWLPGLVAGLTVLPPHQHGVEHAALVRWQPGTVFQSHAHVGGEEILVLDGVFEDEFGACPAGSWLRSPHLSRHRPFSRADCTIYVKTGHLVDPA